MTKPELPLTASSPLHQQSKSYAHSWYQSEATWTPPSGSSSPGGAINSLSINITYQPHFGGHLSAHRQSALSSAPSMERKSQDLIRFCQGRGDLFSFSATPATFHWTPQTLTDGAGVLGTPWGESRCCSWSLQFLGCVIPMPEEADLSPRPAPGAG